MIYDVLALVRSIIRETEGVGNSFQEFETFTWMLALKVAVGMEKESIAYAALDGGEYKSGINTGLHPDTWLAHGNGLTGNELIVFLRDRLFPGLASNSSKDPTSELLKAVFGMSRLYPQSCYKVRDSLDKIFDLDLSSSSAKTELVSSYDRCVAEYIQSLPKPMRFYTPRPLVDMIVELLDPEPGERLYDPAFGTGGFLLAGYREMMRKAKSKPALVREVQETGVQGLEKDSLQFLIGLLTLLISDLPIPSIAKKNALGIDVKQLDQSQKYDIVVCNSTFDSDEDTKSIASNFPITSNAVDLLFMQHIERSTDSPGRGAAILPEGFFFGVSDSYLGLKSEIFKRVNVHTIISLPPLGVKTSVIVYSKPGPTKNVWMYSLQLAQGQKLTKTNNYTHEHFQQLRRVDASRSDLENARLVPMQEIVDKNFNISVSAYVSEPRVECELLSPEEYINQIDSLLDDAKSALSELKKEFA